MSLQSDPSPPPQSPVDPGWTRIGLCELEQQPHLLAHASRLLARDSDGFVGDVYLQELDDARTSNGLINQAMPEHLV